MGTPGFVAVSAADGASIGEHVHFSRGQRNDMRRGACGVQCRHDFSAIGHAKRAKLQTRRLGRVQAGDFEDEKARARGDGPFAEGAARELRRQPLILRGHALRPEQAGFRVQTDERLGRSRPWRIGVRQFERWVAQGVDRELCGAQVERGDGRILCPNIRAETQKTQRGRQINKGSRYRRHVSPPAGLVCTKQSYPCKLPH